MVNSKAWDWKKVNNSTWDNPSEDSYYFLHRWKQKDFNNFLDLGCGKGRHSILFAENGFNVTAVDLSDYSVKELKELSSNSDLNIKCHVSDMVNLEYQDNEFDCLIAYHVISHSDSKGVRDAINEISAFIQIP